MNTISSPPNHQSGAALVISLIILLVLSIIGIQGLQSTTLEEKMAGSFRDRAIALEAAEAGLAAAESYLNRYEMVRPTPADTDYIWEYGSSQANTDFANLGSWADAENNSTNVFTSSDHLWNAAPKFFIEERGLITEEESAGKNAGVGSREDTPNNTVEVWGYRITAIGYGSSPNSQVVLQANYEKTY
ncbi:MAG: pilus assembly protein [Agarilytica sp.]